MTISPEYTQAVAGAVYGPDASALIPAILWAQCETESGTVGDRAPIAQSLWVPSPEIGGVELGEELIFDGLESAAVIVSVSLYDASEGGQVFVQIPLVETVAVPADTAWVIEPGGLAISFDAAQQIGVVWVGEAGPANPEDFALWLNPVTGDVFQWEES